jgi:pimeloyl-ACP methyl ester carboxylesterase
VAAAVHADRMRNRPAGLARALRGLGTGALPSVWDRLAELEMPIVLVVGERDQKFRAIATEMTSEPRRADVVVVPGAGHAVHLEAPGAVAQAISGGVRRESGSPRNPDRGRRERGSGVEAG